LLRAAGDSGQPFQLRPFDSGPLVGEFSLSGSLARSAGSLLLEYRLQGSLKNLSRFQQSPGAFRAHELWRHTCFELFFAALGESAKFTYWEVNLSPSGCWNIYRFDNYRSGMREEAAVSRPSFQIVTEDDLLSLNCTLAIGELIDDSTVIEAGPSVVLETVDGKCSFWALNHPEQKADFHNRQSFLLQLPGWK